MITLKQAIDWAVEVHKEQTYRTYGRPAEPYILHPLRVMTTVSERARVVAMLHDVVEDGGGVPGGLSPTEIEALKLLTRTKGRRYLDYILDIYYANGVAGEIAREVKVADLQDNLMNDPPDSLRRRYTQALDILSSSTPTGE
jgi:hypothetical protein